MRPGVSEVIFSKMLAIWLTNYKNPNSIGAKLRTKRIAPLLACIDQIFIAKGSVSIIDIGGSENYWKIIPLDFLNSRKVHISILNLPGIEFKSNSDLFSHLEMDACNLPEIKDKQFDIAHSNSVLEHVGDWGRMKLFAIELQRVANKYFIQTPNYWFPIEPHCMTPFFHWLPKPARMFLVSNLQLGHWQRAKNTSEAVDIVESARLLNYKMFKALFPTANIKTERLFFIPKSFVASNT